MNSLKTLKSLLRECRRRGIIVELDDRLSARDKVFILQKRLRKVN